MEKDFVHDTIVDIKKKQRCVFPLIEHCLSYTQARIIAGDVEDIWASLSITKDKGKIQESYIYIYVYIDGEGTNLPTAK